MAHWRVEVSVNGESVLAIEPEMLAGKSDITDEEEAAIMTAARHLASFLGLYILDKTPTFNPNGDT